jgi:pimeloyl-ACP methyl ester carboxylesterase
VGASVAGRVGRGLLVAGVVAAVVVGLLWVAQRRLIYLPQGAPDGPAAAFVAGAQDVTFPTADGLTLAGWYVPADEGRPTVLVASGNAGHRGLRAPLATALTGHGLGVLLFDYRGYARNPGSPSEQGLALDARAARSFLVGTVGVPPEQLLYLGESLGAAVVVGLAGEHPPAGLVLRSPFTSLVDVGRVHYPFLPVRALLRDHFPVRDPVSRLEVPTVVVLGTADRIVPPDQSRAVAAAAPRLRELVEVGSADHNDPSLIHGPALVAAVVALADDVAR